MNAKAVTDDVRIREVKELSPPSHLLREFPVSERVSELVCATRKKIHRILNGMDDRLLVVVGPCSIHDPKAAIEYARRLAGQRERLKDSLEIVMRVYFEKPRTTVGWKGLINDPHLDGTFDIATGLRIGRSILLEVAEMGLPTATEMLEPITPQYIADLVSLASIGARTTESPTHRQMASGLSMPVGYKNGTDGNLQVALDAMIAARTPHSFLGIDSDGQTCIVNTTGNPWGHLIVRGGRSGPNFSPESLKEASEKLSALGLSPRVIVDCSHGNSNKDYKNQGIVWKNVIEQRLVGNDAIIGLMLESNLHAGQQKLGDDPAALKHGVSITDACIGWEETEALLLSTHAALPALNEAAMRS